MKTVAVSFTNFGPYHVARLKALAEALALSGDRLIAYETAGVQELYPWKTPREREPFSWVTLFPGGVLEELPGRGLQRRAMRQALERDQPDAVGVVGYVRPESMEMLNWARAHDRPAVLMSESQAIDHPRVWWKEAVKRRRVRRFSSALVGGPRHRDYLASLGVPPQRIALGYNAVDGAAVRGGGRGARARPRTGVPGCTRTALLPRGQPVRAGEEPPRAHPRLRPLPPRRRHAQCLGSRALRRRAGSRRGRRGRARLRRVGLHSPTGFPASRWSGALVRPRRGIRPPGHVRTVGTRRE